MYLISLELKGSLGLVFVFLLTPTLNKTYLYLFIYVQVTDTNVCVSASMVIPNLFVFISFTNLPHVSFLFYQQRVYKHHTSEIIQFRLTRTVTVRITTHLL